MCFSVFVSSHFHVRIFGCFLPPVFYFGGVFLAVPPQMCLERKKKTSLPSASFSFNAQITCSRRVRPPVINASHPDRCLRACDRLFVRQKKKKKTCAIHTRGGRQKKRHILSILHTPPSCCFSSLSAPPDAFSHLLHMRWELRTRRRLSVVNCLWSMRLILSFFLFLFVSEQHSAFFLGVSLWSVL